MKLSRCGAVGRGYAAVLDAMDRFDETDEKLTPVEWLVVVSMVVNHMANHVASEPEIPASSNQESP